MDTLGYLCQGQQKRKQTLVEAAMNESDKNKKQLFVSLELHFFSSHTNIEKNPNEVRKKYMDMKLNAAYVFSVIKQRTTVIKKKTFALN